MRACCWLVWLSVGVALCAGTSGERARGFTWYERFQGSSNALGLITRLDSTVGYNFNQYLGVDGGLPVYFVRPSQATMSVLGSRSGNGMGNAYAELRVTLSHPLVNYFGTLTGTAPTGDQSRGFSTGHFTFDWNNHFEHTFGRLTPLGNIGIANTVSDTQFFVRPFTSYGFVTHLEGGAGYRLWRFLTAGASAYAINPTGTQTIYSKVVTDAGPAAPPSRGRGKGANNGQGVFETATTATGPAGIARDHGFSLFLIVAPSSLVELYAGYTRSVPYALNTVAFGVGFNVGSALKRWRSF